MNMYLIWYLTLFLPAKGGISPYMSVTWPSLVGIGLNTLWLWNVVDTSNVQGLRRLQNQGFWKFLLKYLDQKLELDCKKWANQFWKSKFNHHVLLEITCTYRNDCTGANCPIKLGANGQYEALPIWATQNKRWAFKQNRRSCQLPKNHQTPCLGRTLSSTGPRYL